MGVGLGSVSRAILGKLASSDPDEVSVSSITLFVTLLCICVVLGHLLEENRWINESVNALFIVSYTHLNLENNCLVYVFFLITWCSYRWFDGRVWVLEPFCCLLLKVLARGS